MIDIFIVCLSVVVTFLMWNFFIDPWLDRRPRKAIFVKPTFSKKKSHDKIRQTNKCVF